MNGVDNLAYLNISSATVVPYTAISDPSAPTLTTDNVGGSGYSVFYRVTANSTVGESAASSALEVEVDTVRDMWNPPSAGGTDSVVIGWTAVSNAVSYNVYCGTVSGFEYLIASGVNGLTFTDDGTFAQDTTKLYPTVNSTAGPVASRGANIGGRAWLVGDASNAYKVWYGGDFNYELDFSPVNGGGYLFVGNGSKDLPIAVKSFRDGRGNPQVTVLCQGTNGQGKRFIVSPDSVTIGSTTITFYSVTEDSGQEGTDSPDAVVSYNDSLFYPSRDGFKSTGTKPQLQNILSTNRISNTIQPDVKTINNDAMDGALGVAFEGRIYWALPVSADSNNQIWVLDLERKGAWMQPWNISADWMWLYNDNDGNTHHLLMKDNVVFELTYSAKTADDGEAFSTNGQSGQIYFSEDKRMWAQLLQVVIVLANPIGSMNWLITGKTEDENIQVVGEPTEFTAESNSEIAGWSEINTEMTGWGRNGWSTVGIIPETIGASAQEVIIEVDEEVQWASFGWNTNDAGVDYSISDVILEYIETGVKDLQ